MTEEDVKGAYEQETGNVIVKRFKNLNPVHTPGVLVLLKRQRGDYPKRTGKKRSQNPCEIPHF